MVERDKKIVQRLISLRDGLLGNSLNDIDEELEYIISMFGERYSDGSIEQKANPQTINLGGNVIVSDENVMEF